VAEQQPQAPVVVVAEPGQVQVVVVGDRAVLQQQLRDRRVGRAGHGAAQRRPATGPAGPRDRVGAGLEQPPRHGQQPVRPDGVEAMPP
jgi:hypothetical protein